MTVRRMLAIAAVGAGLAASVLLLAQALSNAGFPRLAAGARSECPWPTPGT